MIGSIQELEELSGYKVCPGSIMLELCGLFVLLKNL